VTTALTKKPKAAAILETPIIRRAAAADCPERILSLAFGRLVREMRIPRRAKDAPSHFRPHMEIKIISFLTVLESNRICFST
jgi:hypothetical protein